jgi:lysophospholipase L1-like esterase
MKLLLPLAALALFSGCTSAPPIQPGAKYVAMGSSFAAGPGIPDYYETPVAPCARSTGNYAHLLAGRLNLALIDVSCSGATTAHLTGRRAVPQGDSLPPQLDALTPDTRLVTVTIGGNDILYISRLSAAGCNMLAAQSWDKEKCPPVPMPTEADYAALAANMDAIAKEIRTRSPDARLVFVDYLTILPATGDCEALRLFDFDSKDSREVARRLAAITAKVAADNAADVVKASELSADHNACSADPWMNGYPIWNGSAAPFHPNAKGMAAVADALETLLR